MLIKVAALIVSMLGLGVSIGLVLRGFFVGRRVFWQRTVVYSLIEDLSSKGDAASLMEIQSRYLQKAQQLKAFRLSRLQLQDDRLRGILLDLQKDGLVLRGEDGRYRLQERSTVEAFTASQLTDIVKERRLRPIVLTLIRNSPLEGISPEELTRKLQERGEHVSFSDVDNLLWGLNVRYSYSLVEGKIKIT